MVTHFYGFVPSFYGNVPYDRVADRSYAILLYHSFKNLLEMICSGRHLAEGLKERLDGWHKYRSWFYNLVQKQGLSPVPIQPGQFYGALRSHRLHTE